MQSVLHILLLVKFGHSFFKVKARLLWCWSYIIHM